MALYKVRNLKRQMEEYLTGQKSWFSDVSSQRMLLIAYYQVLSYVELSKRVFGRWGRPVEILREAVEQLEKALESHALKRIDLEKEIHLFTQKMHELEDKFADQLYNSLPGGGGEEDEVVSYAESTKMVVFSDQYKRLKTMLTEQPPELTVLSLTGMPGIGKTTLARELFKDPEIMKHFDCRVWVRVGRNCIFIEMLRRILVEMGVEEDGDVFGSLNRSLEGKRYLIVLDDVWDKYVAACLLEGVYSHRGNKSQLRYPFLNDNNGSVILVISRLEQIRSNSESWKMIKELIKEIIKLLKKETEIGIEMEMEMKKEIKKLIEKEMKKEMKMELMNREESWHLLREKVFGQWCPSQFEKSGRKIAKKCEGLPLMIVTVANLLSGENKTAELWNEVATRKRHKLFKAAYDQMYKVLLCSFNHLPPCLQKCFMYIGMFPQDYEIPRSKLINFWILDGFLELVVDLERLDAVVECLQELVSNSMVMIKKTLNSFLEDGENQIKTCKLHSSLRYLSNREGTSSKFCHVLESIDDGIGEDIKAQPRLSFHNNVLFAIKEVNKSVEDNCASTAHSLFCYGPYLQYQVPICFGLRLLKKLDTLGIRLYEFPVEVLQLVELRYLALTLNGNLPAGVSRLRKLRFLIVHPHQRMKSCKGSCYLPMEIWNMQELEHLEIIGKDLPNPCGATLEKLSTLARVSPNSCTIDVLEALPKLKNLGIEVELRHDIDGEPLGCLAHISRLKLLGKLKCVIVNPTLSYSLSSLSSLPTYLGKLTLNGLGYAWEEMDKIGSMKYLLTLKLRNYAFRGREWKVREQQFPQLQSIIIEDTDLERWGIEYRNSVLKNLVLKRTSRLKEIYGKFKSLEQIEIVDCNPIGTEQLKKAIPADALSIIRCSWYDEKLEP